MGAVKNLDMDEVVKLHKSGLRNFEIAKIIGCSQSSISQILKKTGMRKSRIDKGKVWALHRARWSLAKIADEMNCEKEDVFEILSAG